MRVGILAMVLAGVVLGSIGGGAAAQPPPDVVAHAAAAAPVRVGPAGQQFDGWGAGVVTETVIDPLADPATPPLDRARMDRLVFKKAGINMLRIWSPWAGFGSRDGRLRADDGRFGLMRRAARRGVKVILTGGGAPASMRSGRALRAGNERAVAAGLVQVLEMAAGAGAPIPYVAAGNELDNSRMPLTMTATQATTVYAELARLLPQRSPATKVVLGDNTGWDTALTYVNAEKGATGIGRPAAIASHAYTGTDDQRRQFAALGAQLAAPVWMTEWTYACPRGDCAADLGIGFGIRRALGIVRDLTVARASAWFLFRPVTDVSHSADDGLATRDARRPGAPLQRGKRLPVFRQFSWAGRPGSRVHALTGLPHSLQGVAFSSGDRLAVVLVNAGSQTASVSLDLGRATGRLSGRRTDAQRDFAPRRPRRYTGTPVALTLGPASVTSLALTATGGVGRSLADAVRGGTRLDELVALP